MKSHNHEFKGCALIIYGEGGHREMMVRLLAMLDISEIPQIHFRESHFQDPISGLINYQAPRIAPKIISIATPFLFINAIATNIVVSIKIFKNHKIQCILTTGPAIAIFPALLAKIFRKKIIFIESWCRFESISITGSLLNKMSALIFYQNAELKIRYPNGTYAGRL